MRGLWDALSAGDMLIGGFTLIVVVGFLGVIAQAVLRESGFGVALNGCLLFAGLVAGAAARAATIGLQ